MTTTTLIHWTFNHSVSFNQSASLFYAFTLLSIIHDWQTTWRIVDNMKVFLWLVKASNYVKSLETERCHCCTNSCCSDSYDKTYPSHLNMPKARSEASNRPNSTLYQTLRHYSVPCRFHCMGRHVFFYGHHQINAFSFHLYPTINKMTALISKHLLHSNYRLSPLIYYFLIIMDLYCQTFTATTL